MSPAARIRACSGWLSRPPRRRWRRAAPSPARACGPSPGQNVTDPTLGPLALDLMQDGLSAPEAVAEVARRGRFIEYRQVLAVDAQGRTAIHSGPNSLGIWTQAQGPDVASGGNLLANDGVPQAIVDGFLASRGHIGDRLIAAMRAGLAAGGEAGPVHSAGMKIVDKVAWPVADLMLRLDRGLPDPGAGRSVGHLQAATGRLCPARAGPARGALLRRAGRRIERRDVTPSNRG
ncbi:MAG: DUF1028 domain-containing protein [Nitrospira sp.]